MSMVESTATATLFFGVCVKLRSLYIACKAWDEVEPAYLAINLIRLRRRRGTLAFDDARRSAIEGVPDEVWAAVKADLLDEAFQRRAVEFVRSYHGEASPYNYDDDEDDLLEMEHLDTCPECLRATQEGAMGNVFDLLNDCCKVSPSAKIFCPQGRLMAGFHRRFMSS